MKTFLTISGLIIIILWLYKLLKNNDKEERFISKDISNNQIESDTKPKSGMGVGLIALLVIIILIVVIVIIYFVFRPSSSKDDEDGDGSESRRSEYSRRERGDRDRDRDKDRDIRTRSGTTDDKEKKSKSSKEKGSTSDRLDRIDDNMPKINRDYSIFNAILPVLLATTPAIRNVYNSRYECLDYSSPDIQKNINALYEGSSANLSENELKSVQTLKFIDNNMLDIWFKEHNFDERTYYKILAEQKAKKKTSNKEDRKQEYERQIAAKNAAKVTASDTLSQAEAELTSLSSTAGTNQLDKEIAQIKVEIAKLNTRNISGKNRLSKKEKGQLEELEKTLAQKMKEKEAADAKATAEKLEAEAKAAKESARTEREAKEKPMRELKELEKRVNRARQNVKERQSALDKDDKSKAEITIKLQAGLDSAKGELQMASEALSVAEQNVITDKTLIEKLKIAQRRADKAEQKFKEMEKLFNTEPNTSTNKQKLKAAVDKEKAAKEKADEEVNTAKQAIKAAVEKAIKENKAAIKTASSASASATSASATSASASATSASSTSKLSRQKPSQNKLDRNAAKKDARTLAKFDAMEKADADVEAAAKELSAAEKLVSEKNSKFTAADATSKANPGDSDLQAVASKLQTELTKAKEALSLAQNKLAIAERVKINSLTSSIDIFNRKKQKVEGERNKAQLEHAAAIQKAKSGNTDDIEAEKVAKAKLDAAEKDLREVDESIRDLVSEKQKTVAIATPIGKPTTTATATPKKLIDSKDKQKIADLEAKINRLNLAKSKITNTTSQNAKNRIEQLNVEISAVEAELDKLNTV